MKNTYKESTFQKDVIEILEKQGFIYINSNDIKKYRVGNDQFFDVQIFLLKKFINKALIKINKKIPEEHLFLIHKKIDEIFKTSNLLESNKAATKLLQNGIEIFNDKINKKSVHYQIIDFEKIENNNFIVTDELKTINLDNEKRRPDLVIYINGFPFIIFEFKTPNDSLNILEEDSMNKAFRQINNYRKQVPNLFVFNFFNVISNMVESKFGSAFSNIDRFNYWRPINTKHTRQEIGQIDIFLKYLFKKKTLLDLFKNYSFFTNEKNSSKIIAAYHQYYGVKDSLKSINDAILNKTGKGGIFWHTQGSGKSYSMVFLTKNFINTYPKSSILVISDRTDLDDQTYQTFKKADEYLFQKPTKIKSIIDLKQNLEGIRQNGIYFSTIQKFSEDKIGILSVRDDILIISDEAHRSHNNLDFKYSLDDKELLVKNRGHAQVLRDAFPNATFTGFTGTPIESEDISTRKIFGNIVTKYPMWMAEFDKFIVPINYEIRFKHLKVSLIHSKKLDEYYETLINEIDEKSNIKNFARKKVNKDVQNLEKIILHSERMNEIANDFIEHYKKRANILKGKAMFIAYNRNAGFKYYNLFTSLCPELKNNIKFIATSNSSDNSEMINLIGSKKDQREYAKQFKDPNSDFKIAIVVDMWLTGFDVPSLDLLYIDKPIKMHNLMQAIARVNRVYSEKLNDEKIMEPKQKTDGLVVDYFGVSKYLRKALEFYNDSNNSIENIESKFEDIDKIKLIFIECLDKITRKYFEGIIYKNSHETKKVRILANTIYVKKLENEFVSDFRKIIKQYNSIIQILNEEELYKFHLYRFVYIYLINSEVTNIKNNFLEKIEKLKDMIANSIIYDESSDISTFKSGKKIKLSDLLKKIKDQSFDEETKHLDAREKEIIIRLSISEISKIDKLRSENLSKKLEKLLSKYEQNFISFEEFILELSNLGNDIQSGIIQDEQLGLYDDELIFYKIIQPGNSDTIMKNDKEKAIEIAKEIYKTFVKKIDPNSNIKWYENKVMIRKIRKELKEIMKKHNFPPEDVKYVAEFYINKIIEKQIS